MPPASVRKLLRLSQLFGTMPIHSAHLLQPHTDGTPAAIDAAEQLNTRQPRQSYRAQTLRIVATLLHLAWTAALFAAMLAAMYHQFGHNASVLNAFRTYMNMCDFLSATLNCTIAIAVAYAQPRTLSQCAAQLRAIDARLWPAEGAPLPPQVVAIWQRLGRFVGLQFVAAASLCSTVATVIVAYHLAIVHVAVARRWALSMAAYILPNALLLLTVMQYNAVLFALAQRFRELELRQRGARKRLQRPSATALEDVLCVVRSSRGAFRDLVAVERRLHGRFAVLMCSTTVTAILVVTIELYQFYALVSETQFSVVRVLFYACWSTLHFGKLFVTLWLCTGVSEAVSDEAALSALIWVGCQGAKGFSIHKKFKCHEQI